VKSAKEPRPKRGEGRTLAKKNKKERKKTKNFKPTFPCVKEPENQDLKERRTELTTGGSGEVV
jgi:hypothetical protein